MARYFLRCVICISNNDSQIYKIFSLLYAILEGNCLSINISNNLEIINSEEFDNFSNEFEDQFTHTVETMLQLRGNLKCL